MSHLSTYIGIFLDQNSIGLLNKFQSYVPADWKWYGSHMTIKYFGAPMYPEDFPKPYNNLATASQDVTLIISHIGISDKAIAVKVNGYPLKNQIAHITLAVAPHGIPADAKAITNWKKIKPITLHGSIKGNGDANESIKNEENKLTENTKFKNLYDQIKKTKSFTTPEGRFSVYDIDKSPNRGDMFTVWEHPDGWIVRNALVPENLQQQNIATIFYQQMNAASIKATGKPLRSTQARKLSNGEVVHELSPLAIKLWDRLTRWGEVEKLGDKNYQFKLKEADETSDTVIPMGPRWNDQLDGGDYTSTVWAAPTMHVKYGGNMSESLMKKLILENLEKNHIVNNFNERTKKIYDVAIANGFTLIPAHDIIYAPEGLPNKCETNVFNKIKSNPDNYYPVGGWMIQHESSLVEHWWIYDIKQNKHIEITPMGDDRGWLTGYLGIINKDINDQITNSSIDHDFSNAPDFLKGGHVYYKYIKPNENISESVVKKIISENLIKHAKDELKRAGLFDKDADYGGMIAKAVMELMKVFSKQGHSGFSAPWVTELFAKLASYETLTPLTDNPKEWEDVSEYCDGDKLWQNKRNSAYFSKDGGKTWYNVDDKTIKEGIVLGVYSYALETPSLITELATTFPYNVNGAEATYDSWTDHPGDRNINELEHSEINTLPFINDVHKLNGKIYQIGGAIRDKFLNKKSKDLDIMISGLTSDQLLNILWSYGTANLVGESFGVIKFKPYGSKEDIDIALARSDTRVGTGHKGVNYPPTP